MAKMSSSATLVDMIKDTVLPEWILGAPAQPRQTEVNALDAFRQRIYMQQVIQTQNTLLFELFFKRALKECRHSAKGQLILQAL